MMTFSFSGAACFFRVRISSLNTVKLSVPSPGDIDDHISSHPAPLASASLVSNSLAAVVITVRKTDNRVQTAILILKIFFCLLYMGRRNADRGSSVSNRIITDLPDPQPRLRSGWEKCMVHMF